MKKIRIDMKDADMKISSSIKKLSSFCSTIHKRCDEIYGHGERIFHRSNYILNTLNRLWEINRDLNDTIKILKCI